MTRFTSIKATLPNHDMPPRRMGSRLLVYFMSQRVTSAGVAMPERVNERFQIMAHQNRAGGVELTKLDHKRANLWANHLYPSILSEADKDLAEGPVLALEPTADPDWTCSDFSVRPGNALVIWAVPTKTLSWLPELRFSFRMIPRRKNADLPHLIRFAKQEGLALMPSGASVYSIADALAAVAPRASARLLTVIGMLGRASDPKNQPVVT